MKWINVLKYLLILLGMSFIIAPIVIAFVTSITPPSELYSKEGWVPVAPTFSRYLGLLLGEVPKDVYAYQYEAALAVQDFTSAIRNSLIIATLSTANSVILGLLASYAFSILRFRPKPFLYALPVSVLLIPPASYIVSLYILLQNFGFLDTKLGLILVYSSSFIPLVIFIMTGYINSLPRDLIESAWMDGYSWPKIFYSIVVPLSTPGIVSVAILSFVMSWNEFFFALFFTNTLSAKTMPVVLAEFANRMGIDYGMTCAGIIFAIIPALVLLLYGSKYIAKGLISGALKA
jgi:multiple sugar transport system permease protein